MTSDRRKTNEGERGSSMMELCFTIPALLMIAGATVDLSRYMRYTQVTTFVSQETASQIYRQCSDITIYNKPVQGSQVLSVNSALTVSAVAQCTQRIQAASQLVLNKTLGGSGVNSNVFRWNISNPTNTNNCDNLTSDKVTKITVSGDTTPNLCEDPDHHGGNDCEDQDPEPGDNGRGHGRGHLSDQLNVNSSPILVNRNSRETSPGSRELSSGTLQSIETSNIEFTINKGIYKTNDGKSLVTSTNLCSRGRVVTVEVAYAFSPIVKFLPNMMVNLDTTGRRREISIF